MKKTKPDTSFIPFTTISDGHTIGILLQITQGTLAAESKCRGPRREEPFLVISEVNWLYLERSPWCEWDTGAVWRSEEDCVLNLLLRVLQAVVPALAWRFVPLPLADCIGVAHNDLIHPGEGLRKEYGPLKEAQVAPVQCKDKHHVGLLICEGGKCHKSQHGKNRQKSCYY